jgi:hypothetical protein
MQAQVKGDNQVIKNTIIKLSQDLQLLHPIQPPTVAETGSQTEGQKEAITQDKKEITE